MSYHKIIITFKTKFDKNILIYKYQLKRCYNIHPETVLNYFDKYMVKVIFLTFGGPTKNYYNAVKRISKEAKNTNLFDKIISYTDIDLKNDSEFWDKHGKFLEDNKTGYGYWLWKPYINYKVIQKMEDNDIIFYADAGCTLYDTGINTFNRYIDIINQSKYGILTFTVNRATDKQYTKLDLLNFMDMNNDIYINSLQICATTLIYRKCDHTQLIINEWYKISSNHDLIADQPNNTKNYKEFLQHRRDQSIFSLLCKKYGAEQLPQYEIEKPNTNKFVCGSRQRNGPNPETLTELAKKYKTDKLSHGFIDIYSNLFDQYRESQFNFLEIGVFFGASIKMWNDYFVGATIYGADTFKGKQGNGIKFANSDLFYNEWNNNKKKYPNIELLVLDQSNENDLIKFVDFCNLHNKKFKVILDDGSHLMHDQQITFFHLFNLVEDNGYFIIEDIHTSNQSGYDVLPDKSNSTKNIFKNMQQGSDFTSIYIYNIDKCKELTNKIKSIDFHFIKEGSETLIINKY